MKENDSKDTIEYMFGFSGSGFYIRKSVWPYPSKQEDIPCNPMRYNELDKKIEEEFTDFFNRKYGTRKYKIYFDGIERKDIEHIKHKIGEVEKKIEAIREKLLEQSPSST